MFHHERRTVPGLNTSSTADISFMLLILFLVTTSMDVDKGVSRQLPPIEKQQTPTQVNSNLVMKIYIASDNKVKVNEQPILIGKLRPVIKHFIENKGKNHIIQLGTSRKASYDTYFKVQNEIVGAYNAVRNQHSEELFGKPYELCDKEQQAQISKDIPQRISEVYELDGKGAAK